MCQAPNSPPTKNWVLNPPSSSLMFLSLRPNPRIFHQKNHGYKTSIVASQKQNNCHVHFPQTSNGQNLHHLVDLQALPAHYLKHARSISVRLAASNAISGHCLFEKIQVKLFVRLRPLLTSHDDATRICLNLLSQFILVEPYIWIKEAMVVSQHGIQMQREKTLSDTAIES